MDEGAWQKDLRVKLEDLRETLNISNHKWNDWELEFIRNITQKLENMVIHVTPNQWEKIEDLWERI